MDVYISLKEIKVSIGPRVGALKQWQNNRESKVVNGYANKAMDFLSQAKASLSGPTMRQAF